MPSFCCSAASPHQGHRAKCVVWLTAAVFALMAGSGCTRNADDHAERVRGGGAIAESDSYAPAADGSPIIVAVPGIASPQIRRSSEVELEADTAVIGVEVNGRHRAYALPAMSMPAGQPLDKLVSGEMSGMLSRHVVNDVIDGVPITATYCDSARCSRVFTSHGTNALDLGVGGFGPDGMLILRGSERFPQKGSPDGLEIYPFKLTTWGKWMAEHPGTDVYVGHLGKNDSR